jgi:hypothetical protein
MKKLTLKFVSLTYYHKITLFQPLNYDEMPFWKYYEFTQEEVDNLLFFFNKPPASFKLQPTFEENVTMIKEYFGIKLHPQYEK